MKKLVGILLGVVLLAGSIVNVAYAEDEVPQDEVPQDEYPQEELPQIDVNFETFNYYSYTPEGDTFTNREVTGSMFWNVGSSNRQESTGEPIPGFELFLDTDIDFDWYQMTYSQIVPVELITEGPPAHWSFGETPVGDGAALVVNPVNPADAPVNFEPGFDVTRSVDKSEFSQADGTQVQKLTIVITPWEEYTSITNNIGISIGIDENNVVPADEGNLVESVVRPLPGDNWFCTPDGHYMCVFFAEWEVGVPITTEIEIEVTPNVPVVEYMPNVWVFEVVESLEFGENFLGDTLVMEQPPLGTWTWTMDSERWIGFRTNIVMKTITFPGVSPKIADFNVGSMFINFGEDDNSDEISVTEAAFSLGEGVAFDLSVDDVTVSIDGVKLTIPAGSFIQIGGPGSEKYICNLTGTGKTKIQTVIDFDEGTWSLIARNIDASLVDNSDGVTLIFSVGDNAAIEQINMKIGGLLYSAAD